MSLNDLQYILMGTMCLHSLFMNLEPRRKRCRNLHK
ncbi:unnamed protein product [Tenebrio molitor]|nr:unnamed protein product [Tenebrio molitor]